MIYGEKNVFDPTVRNDKRTDENINKTAPGKEIITNLVVY